MDISPVAASKIYDLMRTFVLKFLYLLDCGLVQPEIEQTNSPY